MPLKPYCFAKLTILSASFALEAALFTTCKYKLWNVLWAGSDGMLSPSWLRYSQCTYVFSLDSIGGQVTSDGLDGPGIGYWQCQALFSVKFSPFLWPTEPPIQWVKESSRWGYEAVHSHPFSAKAKNEWNSTPITHLCHNGVDMDNFTVLCLRCT
jgi:hypothetical protein